MVFLLRRVHNHVKLAKCRNIKKKYHTLYFILQVPFGRVDYRTLIYARKCLNTEEIYEIGMK